MYTLPHWTDTCNVWQVVNIPFRRLVLRQSGIPCQLFNTAQAPSVPYLRVPKGFTIPLVWDSTTGAGWLINCSKFASTFLIPYTLCPVHAGFPNEYVAMSCIPDPSWTGQTPFTPT